MNNHNQNESRGNKATIVVALIGLIGILITGLFAYNGGELASTREIIRATKTAEAIASLTSVPNVDLPTPIPEEKARTPEITEVPKGKGDMPTVKVTPTTEPQFTPTPITIIVPVWASEENGVRINANTSGVYDVLYLGDAYSPWPSEQYPDYRGWTTSVKIYINRPIEWGTTEYGLEGPINEDDFLGPGGYYLNKDEAIALTRGDRRGIRLTDGGYLTIVVLDEKGRYADSQGKVDIGITYLRP